VVVIRRGIGMLGRVAAQWMLVAGGVLSQIILGRIILRRIILGWIILRRNLLPRGSLHPGRRADRGAAVSLSRWIIRVARCAARYRRLIVPSPQMGERISLTNQACELGERIALSSSSRMLIVIAIIAIVRRIASVLISISHRDDASPVGKAAYPLSNEPAAAGCSHRSPYERDAPLYRISSGAWTPRTANPDARTETTPWTKASRAFVISASSLIMKRK
jgi:hypothetical protein